MAQLNQTILDQTGTLPMRVLGLLKNPILKKTDNGRNKMGPFALFDEILFKMGSRRGRALRHLASKNSVKICESLSNCYNSLAAGGDSGYSGTLSQVSKRY